jgi:AcrR family transcriptional regulator
VWAPGLHRRGGPLPVKGERQLAPWLSQPVIQTVGRISSRTSARGRPTVKRRMHWEARQEQLLEACLCAFASRGLEMTTMDTIAAQAGVSKPLVYRHFHNRFEALLAVVERQSELLLSYMALNDPEAGVPSFDFLLSHFLLFASNSPTGFRLLFQLVDANTGAARRWLERLREQLGRALVEAMLAEAASSELDTEAAQAAWLGNLMVSILEGVAAGLSDGEDPSQRSLALQRLLRPDWVLSSLSGLVAISGSPVVRVSSGT